MTDTDFSEQHKVAALERRVDRLERAFVQISRRRDNADARLGPLLAMIAAFCHLNKPWTVRELLECVRVAYQAGREAEREACAQEVWPTEIKVWSEEELQAMTRAFNRAQEKHGWYETMMAVGASVLKIKAAAIRARGQQ